MTARRNGEGDKHDEIAVTFDLLDEPSRKNGFPTKMMSSHVAMLEPSFTVFYPSGEAVRKIPVTATVHLPAGWSSATALQTADQTTPTLHGQDTTFATVSMEQFVDSHIVAGDHYRQYPLATEISPVHTLDLCAEKAADLELPTDLLKDISNLVRQAKLIFKSYHYDHYDFLVAASPNIGGEQPVLLRGCLPPARFHAPAPSPLGLRTTKPATLRKGKSRRCR